MSISYSMTSLSLSWYQFDCFSSGSSFPLYLHYPPSFFDWHKEWSPNWWATIAWYLVLNTIEVSPLFCQCQKLRFHFNLLQPRAVNIHSLPCLFSSLYRALLKLLPQWWICRSLSMVQAWQQREFTFVHNIITSLCLQPVISFCPAIYSHFFLRMAAFRGCGWVIICKKNGDVAVTRIHGSNHQHSCTSSISLVDALQLLQHLIVFVLLEVISPDGLFMFVTSCGNFYQLWGHALNCYYSCCQLIVFATPCPV